MNPTLTIYVITCLVIGLGPAVCSRYLFKSAWRLFVFGAVSLVASSVIGGFVGGIVSTIIVTPLGGSAAPPTLGFSVLLVISVAIFEEAGRLLSIRWLLDRTSPRFTLPDSLMFGAGFGGAEVIFRAGQAVTPFLLAAVSSTATIRPFELSAIGEAPYFPITFAAISVFHITMSIIAAHTLKTGRFSPSYIFVLLAAYHGAANASSMVFASILFQPALATLMWLLLAATNSVFAIRFLRQTSSNPR
jgi:hypothetical protein